MSEQFSTVTGRQLYHLLPQVYRSRDTGDLAGFLDTCGELLDRVLSTLGQRLQDCFPESCQEWILPYLARLLDLETLSPDPRSQRAEIASAVRWRQRKGTVRVAEEIAQAVLWPERQGEVEVQEGWNRLVVTARVDRPLLPAWAFGENEPLPDAPSRVARHPGLPGAVVDLGRHSRPLRAQPGNPAAKSGLFSGERIHWRQVNRRGVPCFPGSYGDVSARTVDVRTPDWRTGHCHPRRVIIHAPPPSPFFDARQPELSWSERSDEAYRGLFEEARDEDEGRVAFRGLTALPLRIRDAVSLDGDLAYRFENVQFDSSLTVARGSLEMADAAAFRVEVHRNGRSGPVFEARCCLLGEVRATDGPARLEYCTVLGPTRSWVLQASDCIFLGPLRRDPEGTQAPGAGCIRYSRVPQELASIPGGKDLLRGQGNVTRRPLFFSSDFGSRSCGALHPGAPGPVAEGAEDGGEMGAFHDRRLVRRTKALRHKLRDFLPLGVEAVYVPDTQLLCPPPSPKP